jgi:hypothetical protein
MKKALLIVVAVVVLAGVRCKPNRTKTAANLAKVQQITCTVIKHLCRVQKIICPQNR